MFGRITFLVKEAQKVSLFTQGNHAESERFLLRAPRSFAQRLGATLLCVVLVIGMLPTASWADADSSHSSDNGGSVTPFTNSTHAASSGDDVTTNQSVSGAQGLGLTNNPQLSDDSTSSVSGVIPSSDDGVSSTTGTTASAPGALAQNAPSASNQTSAAEAKQVDSRQEICVSAKVVAVSSHNPGESFIAEEWVSLTEYRFNKAKNKTAWDVLSELLTRAGYTFEANAQGVPFSITNPDKSRTLEQSTSAPWSYWSFMVNGQYASVMADKYVLNEGDVIELVYVDGTGTLQPGNTIVNAQANRPDWQADWAGYGNNGAEAPHTTAPTPTAPTDLLWAFNYAAHVGSSWASASEPVLVNGFVYMAVNDRVLQIDRITGAVLKEAKMAGSVSFTARPVYAEGTVVVPLNGGRIQAFSAETLETVWLVNGVAGKDVQSSCTLVVRDGYVYVATIDVQGYKNGTLRRINLKTGALAWQYNNANEGYYWDGPAFSGSYTVISTSAGTVEAFNAATGQRTSTLSLGARVNADCVLSADKTSVYVVSTDGKIHTIKVDAAGNLTEAAPALSLGLKNTPCTPVVVGEKVLVGGSTSMGFGALALANMADGTVQLITQANDKPFAKGDVKSVPLVSAQPDGTYAYFTVNGVEGTWPQFSSGGGVYCYKLGNTQADLIYDAAGYNQYCDSPVIADKLGNLYYINDSGHLLALKAASAVAPSASTPTPVPTPAPSPIPSSSQTAASESSDTGAGVLGNRRSSSSLSGGFIPARQPLTSSQASQANKMSQTKSNDEADWGVKASSGDLKVGEGVSSGTVSSEAVSADTERQPSALNLAAIAGVVLAFCGFGAAVWLLVSARCRRD